MGSVLPVLRIQSGQEQFFDEDVDVKSGVDPHWWHSLENVRRAARAVAEVLADKDPAGAAAYQRSLAATTRKITALQAWTRMRLAEIPRSDRTLVTGHAAFGYFCKEFGFQPMPLLGLSREDEATPLHVANTVRTIREKRIRAVFPEDQANPKLLQEIVRETGVVLGQPLVADGTSLHAHTFETMFHHNVEAIVQALQVKAH